MNRTAACTIDSRESVASSFDVEELQNRLDTINKEYEEFLSIVSHDFSTPLRHIGQFSLLLEDKLQDKLDQDGLLYLSLIKLSVDRSQSMLAGLLALSRTRMSTQSFDKCDCSQLVKEAESTLRGEFPDECFDISFANLPVVLGDKKHLIVLFYQLIKNAVVFRKKDQSPLITIQSRIVNDAWEFSVADNGIGIDEGQEKSIFNAFKKLHTDEEYPGLGLGLTLCKKIVEGHGGSIKKQPGTSTGSTFLFTLPAQAG